jgi:hypothetical protein
MMDFSTVSVQLSQQFRRFGRKRPKTSFFKVE